MRHLLKPRWIALHLAVIVIAATCVSLGVWQLNRLSERRAENAKIAQRSSLPTEDLQKLLPPNSTAKVAADREFRRARVRGSYDPGREVILLSRSNGEETGNHVLTPLALTPLALTPLVTTQGPAAIAIVVDRGWVPLELSEPPVKQAAPPSGPVVVTGVLLPTEPKGLFGSEGPPPGRVKATARLDLPRIAKQLPYRTYPLYLRLLTQQPPEPGGLPQAVPLPKPDEGPHLSYAIQWFSLASVALITYGALIRRELRGGPRGLERADEWAADPEEDPGLEEAPQP
jgi:surfeit locus 1 family protein